MLESCFFKLTRRFQADEQDSVAEDPDAIPSLQLAWEMIELSRVIYKAREEVSLDYLVKLIVPKLRDSVKRT